MTLTAHPLLLVAAAVTAMLYFFGRSVAAWTWGCTCWVRAAMLRRQLERETGHRILYVVGDIYRDRMDRQLLRDLERTPPEKPIAVLIDTDGGRTAAARIALVALSKRAKVRVYIPRRAWSSGTIVALAADELHMGATANLGSCDGVARVDPEWVYSGPILAAKDTGHDVPAARAEQMAFGISTSIEAARRRRGDDPEQARRLATLLTRGAVGSHEHPLMLDDARDLGLPVVPLADRRWLKLALLVCATLPADSR